MQTKLPQSRPIMPGESSGFETVPQTDGTVVELFQRHEVAPTPDTASASEAVPTQPPIDQDGQSLASANHESDSIQDPEDVISAAIARRALHVAGEIIPDRRTATRNRAYEQGFADAA